MKTIKQGYKELIKQSTLSIRQLKYEIRQDPKFSALEKSRKQSQLHELKVDARYTFLAYAVIRGKDLKLVESNPKNPHDPEKLNKYIESRNLMFQNEVSNVII